jgi:hypothetical protein
VKQIWKFASGLIILALVFPTGLFASAKNIMASESQKLSTATQVITLTTIQTSQTIVTQMQPATSQESSCAISASVTGSLVQNGGVVNLNQPASCFTLVPAKVVASPSLAVVTLHEVTKIILPQYNQISKMPSLVPSSASRNEAMPALVIVAAVLVLIEDKKSNIKSAIKSLEQTPSSLVVRRLVVLRC